MAEDVEMTPVEMTPVATEPPKVSPLPPKPGATVSALKPGLKLPPKPGATVSALKPGLKLPPKPGATVSALKPGLKLPPKPGATVSALKPGLKLPAKPGATIAAKPIPRPIPKPIVPPPAAAAPTPAPAPAAPAPAAPTPAPAAEPVKPLDALKTVTQKLKGVTQQIPQQAILHKTGIIADAAPSDAQKEAAKHKTARISLSDAMGVAPVKSEPGPMKTIRIKRPINLPTADEGTAMPPAAEAAEKPAETSATPAEKPSEASLTQRKTLKIARPGAPVRPTKFGVKKPGLAAPKLPTPAGASGAPQAGGEVADIPDIPDLPPVSPMPVSAPVETKVGPFTIVAAAVGLAACVVIGALVRCLYENAQLATFCGGLGWGA